MPITFMFHLSYYRLNVAWSMDGDLPNERLVSFRIWENVETINKDETRCVSENQIKEAASKPVKTGKKTRKESAFFIARRGRC